MVIGVSCAVMGGVSKDGNDVTTTRTILYVIIKINTELSHKEKAWIELNSSREIVIYPEFAHDLVGDKE